MKPTPQRPGATAHRARLRLLGVLLLLLGSLMAVNFAVSSPAQAATLTVAATMDTKWQPFSLNPSAYMIEGTTVTGGVKTIRIASPAGSGFYVSQNFGGCPVWLTVSLGGATPECYVSGTAIVIRRQDLAEIPAGTQFSLTVAASTINPSDLNSFRNITVETRAEELQWDYAAVDSATTRLVWPETVTFDANDGSGTTRTQTSTGPAALDANTFTRAGYTFGGWSGFSFDGAALAYADGATYPFDGAFPTRLYARWLAPAAITPSSQTPSGTEGTYLSVTFTANGFSPTTYSISAGTLPAGLSLDLNSGLISGTPLASSNAQVTIQATDGSATATATITFNIAAAPPEVDLSPVNGIGNSSRNGTVGSPLDPPLVIRTKGMTGPVTFTAVTRTGQTTYEPVALPPGLSLVTTSATAAEIRGTPTQAGPINQAPTVGGYPPFYIAASDNGAAEVYSSSSIIISVAPASNSNTGGATDPGATVLPDTAPATTTPAPTIVGESALITELRQEQLTAPAGDAKLLIGGELVDVTLTQASSDLRAIAPAARTAAQVTELQTLAASMVTELQAVLGATTNVPISVRNTPTGAVIVGLARNPITGEPMDIPVEDVILVSGGGLVLMASGVEGERAARIGLDGALEIPEGGYVSVIAGGLTPGAEGEVVVMSTPRLISDFAVGTSGEIAQQAALPTDLPLGDHTVVVTVGDEAASLGFRLVAASATTEAGGLTTTLPATGSDGIAGSWAVLFVALGALALLMSTRRRTA